MKIKAMEIANYIINSQTMMYEDGEYFAHWSEEKGLNYDGNMDPENITVSVLCEYTDEMSRDEFDSKENLDDPDFMRICEELAENLNKEIDDL